MVAHGHVVALEGRACAGACASLREACARFCPWFAKIICSPVSGTCLAELSKPCANLALPCSTTAFSWGPATKRKCKTCQRHSNVTLILFCLLYLFGKCPYPNLGTLEPIQTLEPWFLEPRALEPILTSEPWNLYLNLGTLEPVPGTSSPGTYPNLGTLEPIQTSEPWNRFLEPRALEPILTSEWNRFLEPRAVEPILTSKPWNRFLEPRALEPILTSEPWNLQTLEPVPGTSSPILSKPRNPSEPVPGTVPGTFPEPVFFPEPPQLAQNTPKPYCAETP